VSVRSGMGHCTRARIAYRRPRQRPGPRAARYRPRLWVVSARVSG
jgi:hypothetical protein